MKSKISTITFLFVFIAFTAQSIFASVCGKEDFGKGNEFSVRKAAKFMKNDPSSLNVDDLKCFYRGLIGIQSYIQEQRVKDLSPEELAELDEFERTFNLVNRASKSVMEEHCSAVSCLDNLEETQCADWSGYLAFEDNRSLADKREEKRDARLAAARFADKHTRESYDREVEERLAANQAVVNQTQMDLMAAMDEDRAARQSGDPARMASAMMNLSRAQNRYDLAKAGKLGADDQAVASASGILGADFSSEVFTRQSSALAAWNAQHGKQAPVVAQPTIIEGRPDADIGDLPLATGGTVTITDAPQIVIEGRETEEERFARLNIWDNIEEEYNTDSQDQGQEVATESN
ncbi:MAG: hypothetical protein ABIA04_13280 [Pseudomonadota bacterium]